MPRRPARCAARTSVRTSSPTIAMSARARPRADLAARSVTPREKNSGRLADDPGAGLGRELESRDERARVERGPLRRQPPRVLVHPDERRAVTDQPEGAVDVVERHVLGESPMTTAAADGPARAGFLVA